MTIDILAVVGGALIVALVQLDIIATVLHPEVRSPLSSRFQRALWHALTLGARFAPGRAAGELLLNWALPLMVIGLIGLWLGLLIVGFALVYFPWINDPAWFASSHTLDHGLLDGLYFSGVTVATLGFGDIQPLVPGVRLLAVLEALMGAITAALSVAYVLAVYPALSQRRTIATALDAEVAGQASGLPLLRRYLGENGEWPDQLAGQLRDLALELLAITESHETHTVLYYAHPRRIQQSVLRVLITTQGLVGLLRYSLSPDEHRTLVYHPHLLLLEHTLHYSLRRLSAALQFLLPQPHDSPELRAQLAGEYAKLCDEIEAIGMLSARSSARRPVPALLEAAIETPLDSAGAASGARMDHYAAPSTAAVADPALDLSSQSPVEAFVVFRLETDPYIATYALASGYTMADARADYPSAWWSGEAR